MLARSDNFLKKVWRVGKNLEDELKAVLEVRFLHEIFSFKNVSHFAKRKRKKKSVAVGNVRKERKSGERSVPIFFKTPFSTVL